MPADDGKKVRNMTSIGKYLLVVTVLALTMTLSVMDPGDGQATDGLKAPVLPTPSHVHDWGKADYNWTLKSLNGNSLPFSELKHKVIFLHTLNL